MMENLLKPQNKIKNKNINENIKKLLNNVNEACIKANKNFEDIIIIGVTKTVEPVYINEAIKCGIKHIGENKVQEFLEKKDKLNLENIKTHFIGTLQTNKVKKIVGQVDMIQSVDSIKLAKEISRVSTERNLITDILLEINIGKETTKSGIFKEEIIDILGRISILPNIKVKGLMSIPPSCENKMESRKYFSKIFDVFIDMRSQKLDNIDMKYISMGMSDDYFEAILEGANIIRPGTAIFGNRFYKYKV